MPFAPSSKRWVAPTPVLAPIVDEQAAKEKQAREELIKIQVEKMHIMTEKHWLIKRLQIELRMEQAEAAKLGVNWAAVVQSEDAFKATLTPEQKLEYETIIKEEEEAKNALDPKVKELLLTWQDRLESMEGENQALREEIDSIHESSISSRLNLSPRLSAVQAARRRDEDDLISLLSSRLGLQQSVSPSLAGRRRTSSNTTRTSQGLYDGGFY